MGDKSNSVVVYNARIITPERIIESGWVQISGKKIIEIGNSPTPIELKNNKSAILYDANGQWLIPGFIDMHVHGGDGADVMDGSAAGIRHIARFHASHGSTGWLPTTLTAPIEALEKSLRAVEEVRRTKTDGASILGLHLEGPFIAPERKGAQNPAYILEPSIKTMANLHQIAPGLIKKVTIAPERPHALEVIQWLTENGVISSIGHTDGHYEDTEKGIQVGATHATHIFNAMRGLHHRDAGVVGACLSHDNVICELIADGHHVHPDVMKLIVKLKGAKRIVLITDAMAATGQPDGSYKLGGLDVTVEGGIAFLTEGHNLAGSTLTMDKAVQNVVSKVGISLQDAIQMASTTPAIELGVIQQKGTIEIGKDADFVLLDESLSVTRTFVEGREVFCR